MQLGGKGGRGVGGSSTSEVSRPFMVLKASPTCASMRRSRTRFKQAGTEAENTAMRPCVGAEAGKRESVFVSSATRQPYTSTSAALGTAHGL